LEGSGLRDRHTDISGLRAHPVFRVEQAVGCQSAAEELECAVWAHLNASRAWWADGKDGIRGGGPPVRVVWRLADGRVDLAAQLAWTSGRMSGARRTSQPPPLAVEAGVVEPGPSHACVPSSRQEKS